MVDFTRFQLTIITVFVCKYFVDTLETFYDCNTVEFYNLREHLLICWTTGVKGKKKFHVVFASNLYDAV